MTATFYHQVSRAASSSSIKSNRNEKILSYDPFSENLLHSHEHKLVLIVSTFNVFIFFKILHLFNSEYFYDNF